MRVLGIDPGLTRCGVGVVEGVPGRPGKLIGYYVVYSDSDEDIALRLLHLDRSLGELIAEHKPDSVAVERVFAQHNVRTVMGTAQASGIAILAGARAGLPVQTYTPSEVKAAVTGSGTAGKAQVTSMVTRLLQLDAPPKPADAADALALAICHIWRGGTRSRIQAATEKVQVAQRQAAARAQASGPRRSAQQQIAEKVAAARAEAAQRLARAEAAQRPARAEAAQRPARAEAAQRQVAQKQASNTQGAPR